MSQGNPLRERRSRPRPGYFRIHVIKDHPSVYFLFVDSPPPPTTSAPFCVCFAHVSPKASLNP